VDEGQSTVELALVLPFVALLALAIVQVAVVAHRQVVVVHAAREGARAAAVSDDDPAVAAARAVDRSGRLDRSRLAVQTRTTDREVSVAVTYRDPTDVPLVGVLLADAALTATATMRRER
jgi:hypothetical protein